MNRFMLGLLLMLICVMIVATAAGAQNTLTGLPNVEQAQEALAELRDWRAILYVAIFLIVGQFAAIMWLFHTNRYERERMWNVADKLGTAATKFTDQTNELIMEIKVLRATASRIESTSGTDAG